MATSSLRAISRCRNLLTRARISTSSIRPRSIRNFQTGVRAQEKRYTTDHEWIELSADGKIGTVGISKFASDKLGEVVYVETPQPNLEVTQGDTMGAVESVKTASDIMAPVSGTILAANELLEEKPGLVNRDPEGEEGWIARIQLDGEKAKGELGALMDAEAYGKFVEE